MSFPSPWEETCFAPITGLMFLNEKKIKGKQMKKYWHWHKKQSVSTSWLHSYSSSGCCKSPHTAQLVYFWNKCNHQDWAKCFSTRLERFHLVLEKPYLRVTPHFHSASSPKVKERQGRSRQSPFRSLYLPSKTLNSLSAQMGEDWCLCATTLSSRWWGQISFKYPLSDLPVVTANSPRQPVRTAFSTRGKIKTNCYNKSAQKHQLWS